MEIPYSPLTNPRFCDIIPSLTKGGILLSIAQMIGFIKNWAQKLLVIVLAVILVMLVASRNVEFELEQQAQQEKTQTENTGYLP